MNPRVNVIEFEPTHVGTVAFTPETLRKIYQTEVLEKFVITETRNDNIPLEQRINIAKEFIQHTFMSNFDKKSGIYKLQDKQIGMLLVLYGVDVVNALFNTRVFEFKT